MNERIKELAYKVLLKTGTPTGSDEWQQLFTELMVKKFDDILILEYLDCVGNKDKQAAERVERLREKVKTYFGVEL